MHNTHDIGDIGDDDKVYVRLETIFVSDAF
jgi:hypothetical protein